MRKVLYKLALSEREKDGLRHFVRQEFIVTHLVPGSKNSTHVQTFAIFSLGLTSEKPVSLHCELKKKKKNTL
jgi:hypothetical protein